MVNMVRGFITAKPELADSDVDLIYAIWGYQLKNSPKRRLIDGLTARDLIKCWKEGEVSSPFNISRSRRKCQQHYPETRGEKYAEKQKHQEVIKQDVKRETNIASSRASKRSRKGS
tara:strand:+ start:6232 stop:6579 length:348 start_codon:yes stop_codon:yes gene_type:complete